MIQTPEQQTYLAKLLGYDYTIQYKSGSSNIFASQIPTNQFFSWLLPNFVFMEQLQQLLLENQD